jgi:hypothetical protein
MDCIWAENQYLYLDAPISCKAGVVMKWDACTNIANVKLDNLEQFIVDCSTKVNWRVDFILGLTVVVIVGLFLFALIQAARNVR